MTISTLSVPSTKHATTASRLEAPFDLVVSDACWNWTERLFAPLADLGCRVLMLKARDWRNAVQQRRPLHDWTFPRTLRQPRLWEQTCVLPPGWMKTYPRLGMRPIAACVRAWHDSLPDPRPLALAISYPHYLYLSERLNPDFLIYYNMDDYSLYWPKCEADVRRLEREAVRRADLSIVCARSRVEELRAAAPPAASRIMHLPHGAPRQTIAEAPQARPAAPPKEIAELPRPLLGFVGSLEDRIDWGLVERLADALPGASIVLIGRKPAAQPTQPWYRKFERAVERPNVHCLGWKTQEEIGRFNAAFDVCLIPYNVEHPFNRASCPTKIMDYMATSRPVVSTAVPECRLYDGLFHIAADPDTFIAAVERIVACGSDDGRAEERWKLARSRTWEETAAQLLEALWERCEMA